MKAKVKPSRPAGQNWGPLWAIEVIGSRTSERIRALFLKGSNYSLRFKSKTDSLAGGLVGSLQDRVSQTSADEEEMKTERTEKGKEKKERIKSAHEACRQGN